MKRCAKCGKVLGEHFRTIYGEERCADCYDDYLTTDRGRVEYFVGICKGDYPMSDFDADFLGWVAECWKKNRDKTSLTMSEIESIEATAKNIGLL